MKASDLHKRLAFEGLVVVLVMVVSGSVLYSLVSTVENYEREVQSISSQVSKLSSESTALRTKYDETRQQVGLYEEAIRKNPKSDLSNNRQQAQAVFNQLQEIYGVNISRVNLSAPRELTEPKYKRPNMKVVSTEFKLSFDAPDDTQFYAMLDALQQDLPGAMQLSSVKLTRAEALSEDMLRTIENEGSYPLIKGDLNANWMLIQPVEQEEAAEDAPAP